VCGGEMCRKGGGPAKDTWNENELERRKKSGFAVRLGVVILECIMGG